MRLRQVGAQFIVLSFQSTIFLFTFSDGGNLLGAKPKCCFAVHGAEGPVYVSVTVLLLCLLKEKRVFFICFIFVLFIPLHEVLIVIILDTN